MLTYDDFKVRAPVARVEYDDPEHSIYGMTLPEGTLVLVINVYAHLADVVPLNAYTGRNLTLLGHPDPIVMRAIDLTFQTSPVVGS